MSVDPQAQLPAVVHLWPCLLIVYVRPGGCWKGECDTGCGLLQQTGYLHPTPLPAGLGNPIDRDHVGGVPHIQILGTGQLGHVDERAGHPGVQPSQHFIFLPEIVHVALHLLEVAAGDPPRVGQKVGDHEDLAFPHDLIRLGKL